MEDYLRPIIRKEPNKIILHVGTNDISHQPASRVAQGIANLGTQIVQDSPATSIVISSIPPRTDKPELSKKVIEANKLLKAFCDQNNCMGFYESYNNYRLLQFEYERFTP